MTNNIGRDSAFLTVCKAVQSCCDRRYRVPWGHNSHLKHICWVRVGFLETVMMQKLIWGRH